MITVDVKQQYNNNNNKIKINTKYDFFISLENGRRRKTGWPGNISDGAVTLSEFTNSLILRCLYHFIWQSNILNKHLRGQFLSLRFLEYFRLFVNKIISTFNFIHFASFVRLEFEPIAFFLNKTRLRGYKKVMLNSAEHENFPAHKC